MDLYLLNALLVVTLITGVASLLALLLRRAPAPWRVAVLFAAVALTLLAPLLAFLGPRLGWGLLRLAPLAGTNDADAQVGQVAQTEGGQQLARQSLDHDATSPIQVQDAFMPLPPMPEPAPPRSAASSIGALPWPALLLSLWAAGTLFVLLRRWRGALVLRRLRRSLETIEDATTLAAVERAAATLGLREPLLARASVRTLAPFSLGRPQPAIVFAKTLVGKLAPSALEAICLHEAAHVRHGHHALGRLQRSATALFWWHPLTHFVNRALDAAKEDVCDNHVLRAQGSGASFARTLVDLAALSLDPIPAAAAGVIPLGFRFEDRVKSLLRERRSTLTSIGWLGTALAVIFSLGTGASALALHLVRDPAQDSKSTSNPAVKKGYRFSVYNGREYKGEVEIDVPDTNADLGQKRERTCSAYFPFAEGAAWKYRLTHSEQPDQPVPYLVTCRGEVEADKENKCWELQTKLGTESWGHGWLYIGPRSDGWYQYRTEFLGGLRGVSAWRPADLILHSPLGLTNGWEWVEQMSVQTAAGLDGTGGAGPSPAELKTTHRVTIEARDEETKVPAGTFRCLKIVDVMKGEYYGEGQTTEWYAPGYGLVKRVQTHKRSQRTNTTELESFTPGMNTPRVDHEKVLLAELARRPIATVGDVKNDITWIEHRTMREWFKTRFARVGGFAFLWRVGTGGAELFDARSKEQWTQLLRDERYRFEGNRGDNQLTEELTRVCALLIAAQKGIKEPDLGVLTTRRRYFAGPIGDGAASRPATEQDSRAESEISVGGIDAAGKRWAATITMKFDDDAVTELSIKEEGGK